MTPEALSKLKQQLFRQEGYRQFPYTDTTGHVTIGIGRNLTNVGIRLDEAEYLLGNDLYFLEKELIASCPAYEQLDDIRQQVLLNMAFNMGISALMQFRVCLNCVSERNYKQAAAAMLDSEWAKQVPNRAHELALMMETDNESST